MKNLLIVFFMFIGFGTFASHIVGGEVYYDTLGGGQYRITFEVYRDCSGTGFDNPLQYTVFNANGTIYSTYSVALPTPDTLPIIYDDPCVTPPNDVCIERAIYINTITLPMSVDGYYVTYQRCCWAANIQNIVTPGSWGITITTHIPGSALVNEPNNCARFNEYPPIVLCSGQTLNFDHSAYDQDGDSLVYSMCDPLTVSSGAGVDPEAPEPYSAIPWVGGFSGPQPYGPGSNVTIDPLTGMMDITPNQIGTFVASVCVEEWRNGVLINQKSRTFGYRVVVCDVIQPMQVDVFGAGTLIEDCGATSFIITRTDSLDTVNLQIFLSGTAMNGVDYNFIPDTLTMYPGTLTDTINVIPYLDNNPEGDETLVFNIVVYNICDDVYDTTTANIIIADYYAMQIETEDSINVCDEFGEYGLLWANVTNGVPPYQYYWEPLSYANNDTLIFPATDLNDNLNLFYVTALDQCGKTIQSEAIEVYNQCPLQVPNVITGNVLAGNDRLIIRNLYDYDRVGIVILNRWGNLVYENDNYQDEFNGKDKGGNMLEEGVYYYIVTPESEKFEYDDQTKTLYSAHGFFHIVK